MSFGALIYCSYLEFSTIKEAVREIKRCNKEVYMPLIHRPDEAQVDFGYALAKVAGFKLCI